MPTALSDFNLTTRKIRYEFGFDLNNDGTPERTYESNEGYINILEKVESVAGLKTMELDSELLLSNPSTRWSRQGIKTYAAVKTTNDNWSTEWKENVFTGSTVRSNTVPLNKVKIKATTYNDDYLDKKPTVNKVYLNMDIASIMQAILVDVGVSLANISLSATGFVLPVYAVSSNWTIRNYIEDLAKGALQVVGFNRSGVFTANTILKNDFAGSFPSPVVTLNLSNIKEFKSREIRGNMYFNDIKVVSNTFSNFVNQQLYFRGDISGLSITPRSRLVYEVDVEGLYPISLAPLVGRNRNVAANLLSTWNTTTNSYFDFYTADDNGSVNNASISVVSMSIVPSNQTGRDKVIIIFENGSLSDTFWLKEITLNGSFVQLKDSYPVTITDDTAIQNDGKRIYLEFESNAIQDFSRASVMARLLQINLIKYANVYQFDIQGRPQLEIGSVIQITDRQGNVVRGVVFEMDSEISDTTGFSQLITMRALAQLNAYLALDDPTRGLDSTYQLL